MMNLRQIFCCLPLLTGLSAGALLLVCDPLPARAQISSGQKQHNLLPVLGDELAAYDAVLGKPAFVEENFGDTGIRFFYKHPLCKRVVVYYDPLTDTGLKVSRIEFEFDSKITWQTAFERFRLSPSELDRKAFAKNSAIVTGILKEAGYGRNKATRQPERRGWHAQWREKPASLTEKSGNVLRFDVAPFPDDAPLVAYSKPKPVKTPAKPKAVAAVKPKPEAIAKGIAPGALPDLQKVLGKGFAAHEATLGKPVSSEIDNEGQNHGERRAYASARLRKFGIEQVKLYSYELMKDNLKAVTTMEFVFSKGTTPTWATALKAMNVSPESVHAVPQNQTIGGVPNLSVMLSDVQVAGAPMATILQENGYPEADLGYYLEWSDKHATHKAPTLSVSYNPFPLYQPVKMGKWVYLALDGAKGSMETLPDGTVEITVAKRGKDKWSNQAYVEVGEIGDSQMLVVTFEAKADATRTAYITSTINEKPYSPIGLLEQNVRLGTEYRPFKFRFVSMETGSRQVKLPAFLLNDVTGTVSIRNLVVKRQN